MMFLDSADQTEFRRKLRKTFFFRSFCKAFIHIRPLEIFSLGCRREIFRRISDSAQFLEPHLRMLTLVFSRLQKNG